MLQMENHVAWAWIVYTAFQQFAPWHQKPFQVFKWCVCVCVRVFVCVCVCAELVIFANRPFSCLSLSENKCCIQTRLLNTHPRYNEKKNKRQIVNSTFMISKRSLRLQFVPFQALNLSQEKNTDKKALHSIEMKCW